MHTWHDSCKYRFSWHDLHDRFSVVQCGAVCCSVLQCVVVIWLTANCTWHDFMVKVHTAAHCNTGIVALQPIGDATHRNTQHNTAKHCNTMQHVAARCGTSSKRRCNTLHRTATYCTMLQRIVPHYNTHCNTMQHIATRLDPLTTIEVRCSATTKWWCNTPQHTAPHYNTLHETTRHHNNTVLPCRVKHTLQRYRLLPMQHSATHSTTLQRSTTLCNAQQHTTTHSNTSYGPPTTHETRCGATANWWCTLVLLQGPLMLLQRLLVLWN